MELLIPGNPTALWESLSILLPFPQNLFVAVTQKTLFLRLMLSTFLSGTLTSTC